MGRLNAAQEKGDHNAVLSVLRELRRAIYFRSLNLFTTEQRRTIERYTRAHGVRSLDEVDGLSAVGGQPAETASPRAR